MANTIKMRRSATQGAVPTTAQLSLGELALNTYDGKLYAKKSVGGVESIVELSGGGSGGDTVSITSSAADVLSVASGAISGVDAGADKLLFWDDSAGKLSYLTIGSNLSITSTTIAASGGGGGSSAADPVETMLFA